MEVGGVEVEVVPDFLTDVLVFQAHQLYKERTEFSLKVLLYIYTLKW